MLFLLGVIISSHGCIGMSFEARDEVMAVDDIEYNADRDDGWYTLPPGEEGMFLSHEGGEDELCKAIFDDTLLPQ